MPTQILSLGNYEKQVILELDNLLTWEESRPIAVAYERTLEIMIVCYDLGLSVINCTYQILKAFELCGCGPADAQLLVTKAK